MALTPGSEDDMAVPGAGNDQTTKKGSDNDTSPKRVNWNAVNNEINKHILASYRAAGALRAANETMFGEDASFKCSWSASLASPRTLCVEKDGKAIVAFFKSFH